MQTKDLDGQVMLFAPDLPCGRTYPAPIAAGPRPERTSGRSLRRSSALKNHTLMLLDLRPGAGNMLGSYWEYDPAWLGRPGPLNTSECPKGAVDAFLSQILQAAVPSKYYLSRTACLGILRRAEERGKPLPPQLEVALKLQAGIFQTIPKVHPAPPLASHVTQLPKAFAANQRDEVRDLHDIASALSAQPGMKQQTFVASVVAKGNGDCFLNSNTHTALSGGGGQAGQGYPCVLIKGETSCLNPWDTQQSRVFVPEGIAPTLASADGGGGRNPGGLVYTAGFSANAGSKAGSTGYHEELAPTLKGGQSGGMMPSVLCLNDQGGSVMDCSRDVAGTLRAQEHGHQPVVLFENHSLDARYRGPLSTAPTISAAYGTGGNNTPLALQEPKDLPAFFSRSRADKFLENDLASTESTRQHKDATDLVCQQTYQDTVGALTSSDHKGPNNQYVGQDKLVVGSGPLLIRRLTPTECELLQGYPPGWTDLPGASDSARYKSLGNSVAIPCVEYLMQGIALVLRARL